jgi:hypothetical protein
MASGSEEGDDSDKKKGGHDEEMDGWMNNEIYNCVVREGGEDEGRPALNRFDVN